VDPKKEEKLGQLFDHIERNLTYLGSSAIKDRLQEGVADTIETVMNADIRVWVLTDDKQKTAIKIAKACTLVQPNMQLINPSSASKQEFNEKMAAKLAQAQSEKPLAFAIDGSAPIGSTSPCTDCRPSRTLKPTTIPTRLSSKSTRNGAGGRRKKTRRKEPKATDVVARLTN